jgi:hypothetical protein
MKSISKGMNNCLRTCLAAAVVVFASGCYIKNPSYPTTWPQTTGSNDIESQIEGSFLCSGLIIFSDRKRSKKSITDFLFGEENASTCEYVEIRKVQPDEMEIRFMYSGGENGRRYYKKNRDYRVEGNWIVLKPYVDGGFVAEAEGYLGGGGMWATPHLTIDVEQDLIIRRKTRMAAIMWFLIPIPMGGSTTDWGRFRRKP